MTAAKLAAPPAAVVRCRYLDRNSNQCTGEAVDPLGEVLLCTRHLARALELVQARGAKAIR